MKLIANTNTIIVPFWWYAAFFWWTASGENSWRRIHNSTKSFYRQFHLCPYEQNSHLYSSQNNSNKKIINLSLSFIHAIGYWAYCPVPWINLIPFSILSTDKLQIATGKFAIGSLNAFSSVCSIWSGKCLQQQMNIPKISLSQYGFSLYTCINSTSFTETETLCQLLWFFTLQILDTHVQWNNSDRALLKTSSKTSCLLCFNSNTWWSRLHWFSSSLSFGVWHKARRQALALLLLASASTTYFH